MAGDEQIRIDIEATDKAEPVINRVADRADQLDKKDPTVTVDAEDKASGDLGKVDAKADALDGRTADITVDANTGQATANLGAFSDKLSGLEDKIGGLGGGLSDLAGGFDALGPAGPVGAAAGAMFAVADHAADAANEVATLAQITGESVETTGQLAQVWKSSGADVGDLADVIAQVNGALQQQPDLARRLGIELHNASPQDVFVQAVDAAKGLEDSQERLIVGSQLFGEEGVRQVAAVNSQYADLAAAIDGTDPMFTQDDIDKARQYKAEVGKLRTELEKAAVEIGTHLVPIVSDLAGLLDKALGDREDPPWMKLGAGDFLAVWRLIPGAIDEVTTSFDDLADNAGEVVTELERVKGALDLEASFLGARDAADTYGGALADLAELQKQGKAGTEEWRDAQRAAEGDVNHLKDTIVGLVDQYGEIPAEQKTKILAELPTAQQKEFSDFIDHVELTHVADIALTLPAADQKTFLAFLAQVEKGATAKILAKLPEQKQAEFIAFLRKVDAGAAARILATLPEDKQRRFRDFLAQVDAGATAPVLADAHTEQAESELNHVSRDRTATITARFLRAAGVPAWLIPGAGTRGAAAPTGLGAPAGPMGLAAPAAPAIHVHVNVDARGAVDPYKVGHEIERRLGDWARLAGQWHPGRVA